MIKSFLTFFMVCVFVFTCFVPGFAGDREWATAGKILTGAVGYSMLSNAAARRSSYNPYYSSPAYSYAPPRPAYYAPAPSTTYTSTSYTAPSSYYPRSSSYTVQTTQTYPDPYYYSPYYRRPGYYSYQEQEYQAPVRYERRTVTR